MSNYTETKFGKYIIRKYNNRNEVWYFNGIFHREDGPAIKRHDGSEDWYKNGKRHREYGPAVKWADGYEAWYLNGQLHRVDGPAIKYNNEDSEWWIPDRYHINSFLLSKKEYKLTSIIYRINSVYE